MTEEDFLLMMEDEHIPSHRRYTKRAQRAADGVAGEYGCPSAQHIGQYDGWLVFLADGNPDGYRAEPWLIVVDEENFAFWAEDLDLWSNRMDEVLEYCRTHKPRNSEIKE